MQLWRAQSKQSNQTVILRLCVSEVHTMLDALLPPNTYFRFNPFMSEDVALDESREEKLEQLQAEGLQYLQRNQEKLQRAISELSRDKSPVQRLSEWLRLRALMHESFYKR